MPGVVEEVIMVETTKMVEVIRGEGTRMEVVMEERKILGLTTRRIIMLLLPLGTLLPRMTTLLQLTLMWLQQHTPMLLHQHTLSFSLLLTINHHQYKILI